MRFRMLYAAEFGPRWPGGARLQSGLLNVSHDGEVMLPGETTATPVSEAMQKIRQFPNNEFETGSSGLAPVLSCEDPLPPAVLRSRSYISVQGSPFFLQPVNWSMELRFVPPSGGTNVVVGR